MIREAIPSDFQTLALMKWDHMAEDDIDYGENNLEGKDKESFLKEFVSFLEDSHYKIFVYEKEGIILSGMFLYIIPKIPGSSTSSIGYLTNVFTKKEYRNQGVGSKLLTYLISYAKRENCELLFVWPSDKSISWYERHGFQKENEIYQLTLIEE